MTALLKLIAAMARVLEEFADAGGVDVMIEAWRAGREQAQAQARLAEEQRLASALARGDLDAVESHAAQLLAEANRANRDRTAARAVDRSGFWHSDDHAEFVGRNDADVETMQREIDALIK